VLAIDGGWYALAARAGGPEFVRIQLLHENFDRFVGHGGFERVLEQPLARHSAFRMEAAFVKEFFPWNLALLAAAIGWWRGARATPELRFLHVWWGVILIFFSVAAGKRTVYLLPVAPAVAILAATALARALPGWTRDGRGRRRRFVLAAAVVGFDVVIATANQAARFHHAGRRPLSEAFVGEIRRLVPPACPLQASRGVPEPDRLWLAYRLDRDIARVDSPSDRGPLLVVPATRVDALAREGFAPIAGGGPTSPLALVGRADATTGCAAVVAAARR
jgi:hypothetical protein